ncbi:YitT family protein [Dellaglioa algida]|uniref:YitT family protein n=1 Tax=Dellaglioa algida TaxID=105612 RepID=UPI000BC36719|nr:YitT family protein [Dellaglioa algida]MDK1717743.1 YitT family protein [Dellaglioa algida]MDK1729353.1 YitT family protein [Dellaglioa algida]MDK1741772.1 YitT family protein [Dellaglioa algida]SOB50859.1 conserved membrane hypothetical protein [Dellaglioa algida]
MINKIKPHLIQFLFMLIGLEIIAISINFFFAPQKVAVGGATGIAILLETAFNWNVSVVLLSINVALLILAYFMLDRSTTKKIMMGSFILPLFLAITPQINVVEDRLLAVIVGGAVFAVGISILYRIDASSGGTTVPPMILKKYFNIKPASSLLVIDAIVCIFNIFVSGIEAFILAIFSLVITYFIMNYIETGLDRKKVLYVMSTEVGLNKLKEDINANVDRGFTIFDAKGGYSGEDKEMLMIIVENQNYQQMLNKVHEIDPNAFIIVYNIAEVHGANLSGIE